jgi:hypothetical protein
LARIAKLLVEVTRAIAATTVETKAAFVADFMAFFLFPIW